MVVCRVALLDGTQFEPKGIDRNSDGQQVFDKVIKHLDIIETDYFGLTFRDKSGKKFWLDNTKKISKQLKGGTWVFEFQVKFYPPDPMSLKEDITRYQLCLQVRVDLFNGRLPCSFATYALLGSYTVQSELGDWDEKEFGGAVTYLHDFDFAPNQNQELLEKIAELHKNNRGQTPTVAEAHFLENAKKLAMYGVDMHDVKDSENKRLALGICATGILVYKDRLRISRFVWPKILKLSYKRDAFYVKVRPGEFEPHERTICFRCDSHKLAKRLWKTCVEHHAFFRLKTADPPNQDTLFPRFNTRFRYSGRTAVQARKAAELSDREEPHIARTAERRSMSDKSKNLDHLNANRQPHDENDLHDNKHGDPDATLERDRTAAGLYGQNARAPRGDDASDRTDQRGQEPGTEGPPGYSADASALSDGGKKTKKDKEDEKRRKKEEERRKKEEEKERKRLEKEKEKEKKRGKAQETAIDDVTVDPAVLEQEKDEKKSGGGLFGGLLRRSQREKSDKPKPAKRATVEDRIEQLKEDFLQLLRETPDITSTSRLEDVQHKIQNDPRFKAVDSEARKQWFNEYVDDMLKADFMRLLRETPSITSSSTWAEARQEIDNDPRFLAVDSEAQRQLWFEEYQQGLIKSEFMDMLKDSPAVTSTSQWDGVREYLQYDPRYKAVNNDAQREEYFDEYIQNLKKEEFMQLLDETPDITSYSRYADVREDISHDPRFHNVDSEALREQYFNEYILNLKKANYFQLLQDTPDITAYSRWHESKHFIDTDPRYHAVDTDLHRAQWFNQYVNRLAGIGYGDSDFGLRIGGYKSIDRRQEFLPIAPSSTAKRTKSTDEPMPFFEPVGETDVDAFGKKKVPPPVAKKPRGQSGYESEEDRLLNSHSGVYKTERDGVVETRVERKITVTSDENDDIDHDELLRRAILDVTMMNPDLSVEKIECMRQIEEVTGN